MSQPTPRRLTRKQLRFLRMRTAWAKIRKAAWKRMPEKMEAIRRKATKEAARRKDKKNQAIRSVVACWPETLTTYELRERIREDLDYRGKVTSLIYRMRRNTLLEFREDGRWHNLCQLPPTETSLNG